MLNLKAFLKQKRLRKQIAFLSVASLVLGAAATTGADTTNRIRSKKARIIALTDFHGALEEEVVKTKAGENVHLGGAALLSSYIDRIRAQDSVPTFVVDAGDLFQGTLISNSVEGAPVIQFYNQIGVDAAAIGNHDFDYGPVGENPAPKTPSEDPRGALKARMKEARFPFLAANIRTVDGSTPEWAKPSVLIERGGVKVGIIGIASPGTRSTTLLKNVEDLNFVEPTESIVHHARLLREQGADFVVLTSHMGGGCKDNSPKSLEDLSSCSPSELFDTVRKLPKGTLDLAVGGHTHQGVVKFVDGVPVLQSFSKGGYVAWANLSQGTAELQGPVRVCGEQVETDHGPSCEFADIKASTGKAAKASFLGSPILPDSRVVEMLKGDVERVAVIKAAPLGVSLAAPLVRDYYEENALGNFLADLLAKHFKDSVDLVILNNGGLRANIDPGPLTYGDIYAVLPFDNRFAIVTANGKAIRKLAEIGIARDGGGISWSGLSFSADRCRLQDAQALGAELEDLREYRLLAPDFVAQGGIGFASLKLKPSQIRVLEDLPVMRDVVADTIKRERPDMDGKKYYDPAKPRQRIKSICEH